MNGNGKSRDELARQANLVRSKLLHTVEQLDQRRQEVFDLRKQLRDHMRQLAAASALLVVGTAGVVALLVHQVSTAAERRRRTRWRAARTLWNHPERALRTQRPPFWIEVLRSLAFTAVTAALAAPVRRFAGQLGGAAGKTPRGRVR